jgi:hypothetical protein
VCKDRLRRVNQNESHSPSQCSTTFSGTYIPRIRSAFDARRAASACGLGALAAAAAAAEAAGGLHCSVMSAQRLKAFDLVGFICSEKNEVGLKTCAGNPGLECSCQSTEPNIVL